MKKYLGFRLGWNLRITQGNCSAKELDTLIHTITILAIIFSLRHNGPNFAHQTQNHISSNPYNQKHQTQQKWQKNKMIFLFERKLVPMKYLKLKLKYSKKNVIFLQKYQLREVSKVRFFFSKIKIKRKAFLFSFSQLLKSFSFVFYLFFHFWVGLGRC